MITPKKALLLKYFVDLICEGCHKKFKPEELEIHRIFRGNLGGEYSLRNVKVLCSRCHKNYHANEEF